MGHIISGASDPPWSATAPWRCSAARPTNPLCRPNSVGLWAKAIPSRLHICERQQLSRAVGLDSTGLHDDVGLGLDRLRVSVEFELHGVGPRNGTDSVGHCHYRLVASAGLYDPEADSEIGKRTDEPSESWQVVSRLFLRTVREPKLGILRNSPRIFNQIREGHYCTILAGLMAAVHRYHGVLMVVSYRYGNRQTWWCG